MNENIELQIQQLDNKIERLKKQKDFYLSLIQKQEPKEPKRTITE